MFNKKTISDIDLKDKAVVVRVDYNVPIRDGQIADSYRIEMSMETINALLEQNAKIILISHLGRPEGEVKPEFSLRPEVEKLSELAKTDVKFASDCVGEEASRAVKELKNGEILLLENLRFHKEEEANDMGFAKELASYGQVFVQDGFGVVHRAHASTDAITKFLPSVSGLLVEREVRTILKAIEHPKQPLVAIIGGVKIKTKIKLLEHLIAKSKILILGGAMANTFLKAKGLDVGNSLYDENELDTALRIIEECKNAEVELILPFLDVAVGKSLDVDEPRREVETDKIASDDIVLGLGEKTIKSIILNVSEAGSIIWNGPLGMTELNNFRESSIAVAEAIANSGVQSVVGGGDTAEFIRELNLMDKYTLVSTGGGASLELMSGGKLPGVEALLEKT
jgi:3-phosphoglycerate kinase